MKTYMIVTNDKYELPVAGEFLGVNDAAEWLGMKVGTIRTYLFKGFPANNKYKVVVISERQIEDMAQHKRDYHREYSRKRRMYKGGN